MKIGMICRMDNSGLGTLSWEFANHLRPRKILLVENAVFQIFPERYKDFQTRHIDPHGTIRLEDMEWLCEGTDVILSIETFYNWDIVSFARRWSRVKTALVTMVEMMQSPQPPGPDLLICPSELDFQLLKGNKVLLPVPLNTERLVWRKRGRAKVFVHTSSHGGTNFRKGTGLLLEAMKYVKSDAKVVIYSWMKFSSDDPRIETRKVNFKNYWQCWQEGDVLVYPQDYNGICLPVIEAMASGLGVISTDIFPFNTYLPKHLLFKPESFYTTSAGHDLMKVVAARISPKSIAEKVDEWYGKDISEFSEYGRDWARNNSWEVLLPRYQEILENLCKQ